jgi:hypothetical protein
MGLCWGDNKYFDGFYGCRHSGRRLGIVSIAKVNVKDICCWGRKWKIREFSIFLPLPFFLLEKFTLKMVKK